MTKRTMSIVNTHARWAFDINAWKPTLQELKIATSCIQQEEKERLGKFLFQEDFKSSLAGRLLMRQFVRRALKIDYNNIHFGRDLLGKPFLMPNSSPGGVTDCTNKVIDFNVSHQGSFACLAGFVDDYNDSSKLTKIGVDCMKIEYTGGKPLPEFFRLMTRNFADDEWSYIKSFNSNYCKLEAFMRNWCLKESYVKNIGTGITVDLKKLNFNIKTPELQTQSVVTDTCLKVDGINASNFMFEESLIDNEHCVVVSIQNNPINECYKPQNFEILEFHELIKDAVPILDVDENYCIDILKKDLKN